MTRRLLQITTVLLAALLGTAAVIDVASCGSIHARCTNTPQWHIDTWIAEHQGLALTLSVAYALAVVALFGRQIPGTLKASIRPHFALRATAYVSAIVIMLLLALHFPVVSSLFR